MARLRTFIAVAINRTVRNACIEMQETLSRSGEVKWVEPENLHLTLLFLGEIDEREIIEVCRAVARTCADIEPFQVNVRGIGAFPNLSNPRTVWVGITDGSQALIALHDRLEAPLLELGCYRREDRRYTPHLTLGRVRSDVPPLAFTRALSDYPDWAAGEFVVTQVQVMSSELRPSGPVYSVLSRANLQRTE